MRSLLVFLFISYSDISLVPAMSNQLDLFSKLSAPFETDDIEWRVQQSGVAQTGRVWAMVIPYITNRAIQSRLDSVFGPTGWKNEYKTDVVSGGVLCGISAYCPEKKEWITKWDGVEVTKSNHNNDIDSIKTAMSNSMKRAAVHWGVGRYLYNLEATFAECYTDKTGKNRGKVKGKNGQRDVYFTWNPPILPANARPSDVTEKNNDVINDQENNKKRTRSRSQMKSDLFKQQRDRERSSRQPHKSVDAAQKAVEIIDKAITPAQVQEIRETLKNYQGVNEYQFCERAGITQIGQLAAERYQGAISWIMRHEPVICPDEEKLNGFINAAQSVVARHNNRNNQKQQTVINNQPYRMNGNGHQRTKQRINNGHMNTWERRDYDREMFEAIGSAA